MSGGHGGGGEYQLQTGFGWTNGIIMELLEKYGDRLTAEEKFASPGQASASVTGGVQQASVSSVASILTAILALLATFAAGCIG